MPVMKLYCFHVILQFIVQLALHYWVVTPLNPKYECPFSFPFPLYSSLSHAQEP